MMTSAMTRHRYKKGVRAYVCLSLTHSPLKSSKRPVQYFYVQWRYWYPKKVSQFWLGFLVSADAGQRLKASEGLNRTIPLYTLHQPKRRILTTWLGPKEILPPMYYLCDLLLNSFHSRGGWLNNMLPALSKPPPLRYWLARNARA